MDEKDMTILNLRIEREKWVKEAAKWRSRALEAADRACGECDEYVRRDCEKCRVRQIREEAEKP